MTLSSSIRSQLKQWEGMGYGAYPICMAKTQYSFSTDPTALGAPTGFDVEVNECASRPAPASWWRSAAAS